MTLLFDLDGTLLDSNDIWRQIDVEFLARRGIPWTETYNQGVIHATFPTAARFTREFCRLAESEDEIMAEWMDMAYRAYSREIPLKPGVAAFLNYCADRGHTMAIYTSCEQKLCYAALEHHNLRGLFQSVFFARELGVEKRAPEGFRTVARLLGVAPEQCIFFDDSSVACKGAKIAGMQVVACKDPLFASCREEMAQFCDYYLDSFEHFTL